MIIAIMSIASYLTGKGEHTALYKFNINTWGKKRRLYSHNIV